jgi:hypothetical protein
MKTNVTVNATLINQIKQQVREELMAEMNKKQTVKQRTNHSTKAINWLKAKLDKGLDKTAYGLDLVENEGLTYGMEKTAKGLLKLGEWGQKLNHKATARKSPKNNKAAQLAKLRKQIAAFEASK